MRALPGLSTDLFDYDLPDHLIAQTPAARRDESRLLVVHRASGTLEHRSFRDLPDYLGAKDTLFRNNAAVLPARLRAQRPTGGGVECFLLRPESTAAGQPEQWWCLLRPAKKLPVGARFAAPEAFSATVLRRQDEGIGLVQFDTIQADSVTALANRVGAMPLPPYIARETGDAHAGQDLERYQTVYAQRDRQVAVAAPTAGLHFTPELLNTLTAIGTRTAELTLHVGLGTFRPIMTDSIEAHAIHREIYEVPVETQTALFDRTRRRVAVGTTSVRSIEDYLSRHAAPGNARFLGEAGIYLYPPRDFRGVDALITNFHQPRSTLLCLVAAFLDPGGTKGIDRIKAIYAEAVAREYRFFSYGDAMLIL